MPYCILLFLSLAKSVRVAQAIRRNGAREEDLAQQKQE
jgi:hypothetical protein